MKFLRYILFLLFVVMLTPSTMVALNEGEWQEACDGSVAGNTLANSIQRSLRQVEYIGQISRNYHINDLPR